MFHTGRCSFYRAYQDVDCSHVVHTPGQHHPIEVYEVEGHIYFKIIIIIINNTTIPEGRKT